MNLSFSQVPLDSIVQIVKQHIKSSKRVKKVIKILFFSGKYLVLENMTMACKW